MLIAATGRSELDALQQVITVIGLSFFVMGFLMMVSPLRLLRPPGNGPAEQGAASGFRCRAGAVPLTSGPATEEGAR